MRQYPTTYPDPFTMDLADIRRLLPEFKATFLDTPKGRDHLSWFPSGRAVGRSNLAEAIRRAEVGEDVTEFVLTKLLPHFDSPHNRERGAWCCIAPAITRDIRQWFEGIGWAKSDDWSEIAKLLLGFIRTVTSDPERLTEECHSFRDSPYSKGFQSGFLSPILNAVRPSAFALVNSKTRNTLKSLAHLRCGTQLVDYPTSNALVRSIVEELGAELPAGGADLLPCDIFDAFCHWAVAIYKGSFGPKDGDTSKMNDLDIIEERMRRFFTDDAERLRICRVLADRIDLANAHSPSCWEITVRNRRIRLNIGRLAALELSNNQLRLGLVPEDIPDDVRRQLQEEGRWSTEFTTRPVTRLCQFEPFRYWQLEDVLAASGKEFVRIAAQTGLQSPFHRFNSPEMLNYLDKVLGRVVPRPLYQPIH
jgi:hypothetical protein